MRIEQLRYLCEIAHRRSMNIASEKLHVAQQTLSTSIKSLESELGIKLLERTYQGVYPTKMGQEVIDWAEETLYKLDHLQLKITSYKDEQTTGHLTVAVDRGLNMVILPKILSHFFKFYPNVSINIFEMGRADAEKALRDKTIDIGIIPHYDHLPTSLNSQPLLYEEILNFTFYARVNRRSPLATEDSLSLKTLLNYPFAMYDVGTSGKFLTDILNQYGDAHIFFTNHPNLSQQVVNDNLAVSLSVRINNYVPPLFHDYNGNIVTIPLKETLPFYGSYAIHRDNLAHPIANKFIDVLTRMT